MSPLLAPVIRTPTSIDELREMLLQSSWIPWAVGHGWSHQGHLDGGFTMPWHPSCAKRAGMLVLTNWDLMANILNVNLSRKKAEALWDAGLAHGL